MNINPTSFTIVINQKELEESFPDYCFPFSLNKMIKEISKKDNMKNISDNLMSLIKRDPEMKTSTLLTSRAYKNCGIYKIRIKKDNNRGKSSGYRVVFLLITAFNVGYVLDITDHNIQNDLTDEQKKFCNKLTSDLENELKKYKE